MSFFYAIQLSPEVAPNRVKLGFTTNPKQPPGWERAVAAVARRHAGDLAMLATALDPA